MQILVYVHVGTDSRTLTVKTLVEHVSSSVSNICLIPHSLYSVRQIRSFLSLKDLSGTGQHVQAYFILVLLGH